MTAGSDPALRFVEAPVAEVVLSNPGRLNAMTPAFFDALSEVFGRIAASDQVRAVVVWAEGRAFSIGLDKELSRDLLPPPRPGNSAGATRGVAARGHPALPGGRCSRSAPAQAGGGGRQRLLPWGRARPRLRRRHPRSAPRTRNSPCMRRGLRWSPTSAR